MSEPVGDHNFQQHLTAFADGGLDAPETLALLEYLLARPGLLERSLPMLRDQQRLRIAAGQLLADLPDAGVDGAEAPAHAVGDAATPGARRDSSRRNRQLAAVLAAGAAVGLVGIGVVAGRYAPARRTATRVLIAEPDAAIPVAHISGASRVHADCSRLADALHSEVYPREFAPLAETVKADLEGPNPYPNLSSIGYHFVGTGRCPGPLPGTLHLLYRQRGPEPRGALSIFVQPHPGVVDIEHGKLYDVAGPRGPYPVFAWRTDRIVYYLIADDGATAMRAIRAIAVAPAP